MNYKSAGVSEIVSISNEFENYSLGQVLFAILNRKPEGISLKKWLFEVGDEDLYTAIERTKLIERPESNGFTS